MAVNKVEIDGETKLDLTADTVTPETLLKGATAHNAAGEAIVGSIIMPTYTLVVKTSPSSVITVTKGTKTFSGTADASGECTFSLPEVGLWTVTIGDLTYTQNVGVWEVDNRPTFRTGSSWYRGTTKRNTITQIHIVDSYTPTGTETESWNADENDAGDIKCYVSGTVLTITGNGSGRLWANSDSSWFFSDPTYTDEFKNVTSITGLHLIDTRNMVSMHSYFEDMNNVADLTEISSWDVSNCTDMFRAMNSCKKITVLDLSGWNTSKVTNMWGMFLGDEELSSLNVANWDTSNVTTMEGMFNNCYKLSHLDASSWDTSNVTTMEGMFGGCSSLSILNVSGWDTSNVTNMQDMFYECVAITQLDLSSFDTSAVTNMSFMFAGCKTLVTIYASSLWNISAVTKGTNTFINCYRLHGGIYYNDSKWSYAYANTSSGGYLTYKAYP